MARVSLVVRFLLFLALFLLAPQMGSSRPLGGGEAIAPPAEVPGMESLAEKYRPLLLSLLPRGRMPPAGPHPGINDNQN